MFRLSTLLKTCYALVILYGCQPPVKDVARDFLLSYYKDYSYIEQTLIDHNGNRILFSPYEYENLYIALDSLDAIKASCVTFKKAVSDSVAVSYSFISSQASDRVKQWKDDRHNRDLSLNDFLEYWLPYRIEQEKFCDYHDQVSERFGFISDSIKQGMSVTRATNMLQDELRQLIRFDLRSHADINQPSILETMDLGRGSCRSITILTTIVLRELGIVSTIDECPVWAHRNSGHQWNVIRTEKGEWIPFNGAEDNVGKEFNTLTDSVKAPKIFRKQFSRNLLFAPQINRDSLPRIFINDHRKDVTSTYLVTKDVTVIPTKDRNDPYIYLAVFNANEWKIVSWAEIKDGKATFKDMGCNEIVYLPVYHYNHTYHPAADPFILHKDGSTTIIQADTTRQSSLKITYSNCFYDTKWLTSKPGSGRILKLYYWNDGWRLCDTHTTLVNEPTTFHNVPERGLYLINFPDSDNTWQRIFTLNGDEQIWY